MCFSGTKVFLSDSLTENASLHGKADMHTLINRRLLINVHKFAK